MKEPVRVRKHCTCTTGFFIAVTFVVERTKLEYNEPIEKQNATHKIQISSDAEEKRFVLGLFCRPACDKFGLMTLTGQNEYAS